MEPFLVASKTALSNLCRYKEIRVVLGNPSCDLDSAVCALIQGFSEYLNGKKSNRTDLAVIPLLNIPEKEYRVKTEVIYYLELHNIPSSLLTFRDQINLKALGEDDQSKLKIILVDHHNLSNEDVHLADFVVEVIDHRPLDASWPWPGRAVCLESVGSCATLVARNFLRKHPEMLDAQISSLLRGPIVIDTCNFSKAADRVTAMDVEVMGALEKIGPQASHRDKVFEDLMAAKADISKLTADDLMIRDLKVTAGVPIVGLPLLIGNFLTLPNARESIKSFAESRKTTLVVLIGLEAKPQRVTREVALFFFEADHLKDKIIQALVSSIEPPLELTLTKEVVEKQGGYTLLLYNQGNLRASRKQILPIIRDTVLAVDHQPDQPL